jgi:uncharacterized repeat protein (TIGR02543 family)
MRKYRLIACLGLALGLACISCDNTPGGGPPDPPLTEYTIRFQTGSGGTALADTKVPEGTTFDLGQSEYQPERDGYSFDCWFISTDTAQTPIASLKVTGNITLVAKWLSNVSVTLNLYGGKMEGYPDFSSIRPGEIFDASSFIPSRTGYIFQYWYLKDDPYYEEVESIQVYTDITLVALWEEGWVVTLNLYGGEYYGGDSITVAKGDTLELARIKPVKDDCVLEGWYYDAGFIAPVPAEVPVTTNISLYVKWLPLGDYASLFGVWKGSAGTYLLYHEENESRLIGFYFSTDEICSFIWTETINGKTYSLASGILTVGLDKFTAVSPSMMPVGSASVSTMWVKGEEDDPVSLFLFDNGNASLYANGITVWLSYALRLDTIYLLRQNTGENGNPRPGEVLLTIPIVDD